MTDRVDGPPAVEEQKSVIVARYGPWTAHNMQLDGSTYTVVNAVDGNEHKLRRVVQIISDYCSKPLSQLRILDLGCLEGLYAVELAMRGAAVVAVEAREANIEKARFAQRTLGVGGLEFIQEDVRNIDAHTYGQFDVVLCLNLLLILDGCELGGFLSQMADLCAGMTIIETDVSFLGPQRLRHGGTELRGVRRNAVADAVEERGVALWGPVGTPSPFEFTRASLCNALSAAGFTSVLECYAPSVPHAAVGSLFIARHGEPQQVLINPLMDDVPALRVPEDRQARLLIWRTVKAIVPALSRRRLLRRVWRCLPKRLRRVSARGLRGW